MGSACTVALPLTGGLSTGVVRPSRSGDPDWVPSYSNSSGLGRGRRFVLG